MQNPFRARPLTRPRIVLVLVIAAGTDAIQLALGPLGWTFFDEIMDVLAMALITLLIGFHPLLLPTFVVELLPIVDMMPTWTGCVGAVLLLRKRASAQAPNPATTSGTEPPAQHAKTVDADGPVIDV